MLLEKNTTVFLLLPHSPSCVERFAAEELIKYLRLSMGITVQITEELHPECCTFILGFPQRISVPEEISIDRIFENKDIRKILTGPEGMYLAVRSNLAVITGSEGYDDFHRGTLYGVYEFLERCLGCCFGAFCGENVNAGETIPTHEKLFIEDFSFCKPAADLSYRTAIVQYSNWAANADRKLNIPFIDWLCKNRYNRILTWVSVYEKYKEIGLLPELEKRGIRLSVGHHESAATWLPHYGNSYFAEHYYETHPEFYRLQPDGTRFKPTSADDRSGQWIYCSRNRDCIRQVSDNIIRWVHENPSVDVIAFWPNDDSYEQCCCDACKKYSKSENYAYFQNEMAALVSAACPHVKIDMLVYQDLWECPEHINFCDALLIDESTWTPQGLRNSGKPDGSCLIGTNADRNLLLWKEKCSNTVYYDYYMGVYSNKQRIIPMADEIRSIFKYFTEKGILGSGTQIECFNVWNNLLNFYTFGRTAYDMSLSLKDNISQIVRLYGEGGETVAQIFELYEQALDGEVPLNMGGCHFMTHIDKNRIYTLFDQALDAAKTPIHRNNIRLSRMAFRYTDLEVNDPLDFSVRDEKQVMEYTDPSGELGFLATYFDSFTRNDPGYAITIPAANINHTPISSRWYSFE